jgi:hypothetical protein
MNLLKVYKKDKALSMIVFQNISLKNLKEVESILQA